MQQRVVQVWTFLLVLVALDQGVGFVLARMGERIETGESTGGLVRQALAHRDADVMIFGSSRARRHVDPDVLDAHLGTTTWNAACDAQTIPYALMVETLVLEEGTDARLFVLTPEPAEWVAPNVRAQVMAQFAGRSDDVDRELWEMSTFERFKLMSGTYRFNSRLLPMLKQLVSPTDVGNRGFVAMHGELDASQRAPRREEAVTLAELGNRGLAERQYRTFIRRAKEHGIEVLLTMSPRYVARGSDEPVTRERIITSLEAIAHDEGAHMARLDEVTNPELNDPRLFRDPDHLNADGARRFSVLLAAEIERVYSGSF